MKEKIMPRTLSGFMELMPQEQILFNKLKKIIEDVYISYGFYPIDTPIIESSEVLLAKAGGETEKQIYRFNKGNTDLSLRFDLTVPLAKYVASKYNELTFPFKRYQIGKVFRGERAQKGRFREFYQCDIDVVGNESLSLMYDCEIPSIIYDIFTKLNIGDFVIRINNRKILIGFFENLGLTNIETEILRIIDKIDKIGINNVKQELVNMKLSADKINAIINFILIKGSNEEKIEQLYKFDIQNKTFIEGVNELEFVIKNLKAININENNYAVDLTIARGLDYYTGTIYETNLKEYPSLGSICSGGRYENLVSYYIDKKLPGVGISIGLTRLFYQLCESNIIDKTENYIADIIVLPLTYNFEYVFNYVKKLRKNGIKTDIVYLERLKQSIKYANRQNAPYVIIIGDDEVKNGNAILKNMKTGEQQLVTLSNVLNFYEQNLNNNI